MTKNRVNCIYKLVHSCSLGLTHCPCSRSDTKMRDYCGNWNSITTRTKWLEKKITVTNMIFSGFNLDSKITFYLSFTRNRKGGKFVFSKKQYASL